MKYCQFCGKMLEDGAQCTCEEARAAAQVTQPIPQQPPQSFQQVPPQQVPPQQIPPQYGQVPPQYGQQVPPQYGQQVPPQYAQQVPPQQAPKQPSEMQQKAKAAASGLMGYLKSYFASPAKAVQDSLARQDMTVSIILTVVRVLALGLAIFGVLNKVCGIASSAFKAYGYSASDAVKISVPFFESLLYGGLIAIIGMGLYILVVFVSAKAQKSTISLGGAWQASANNGVMTTALLLLAFLLSFVSIPFALALIALSILSSLIFGVLSVQHTCPGSDSGLCWLVYFIGAALVIFIGCQLFLPLFLKAMGAIKVTAGKESFTLGTALDELARQFKETFDAFDGDSFTEIIKSIFNRAMYY